MSTNSKLLNCAFAVRLRLLEICRHVGYAYLHFVHLELHADIVAQVGIAAFALELPLASSLATFLLAFVAGW